MKTFHELMNVLADTWLPLFAFLVVLTAIVVYWRSRKQILFESWVNMFDSKDTDTGRSVGDLLLFKIGYIKNVHQKSAGAIGNWNVYRDVPAFRQSLDDDVKLLASAELGKYGSFVTAVSMVLFRLLPMMFRPARLKGSIHKHGSRLQLLATLEAGSDSKWRNSSTSLWEVVQENSSDEQLPAAVEELAFRIYLDLTREEIFKTWEAFQAYTRGLASYISYIDLQRTPDAEKARTAYQEALAIEPQNPAIKYSLGVLLYYQWNAKGNDEAIDFFRGALASSQSVLRAYANSGLANALLMKYHRYNVHDPVLIEDAVFYAQRAVELAPDLDMSNRALGFACHQLSEGEAASPDPAIRKKSAINRDLAIKHYQRSYEINPKNFPAHNNLANLYLEWAIRDRVENPSRSERNFKNAIRECEEALAINAQYHMAYDNMGNAYYELHQFDKAAEAFKNAVRYKSDYPEGTNDQAALLLEPGFAGRNVAEALRYHQEALALIPQPEQQKQRLKLCTLFGKRWQRLSADEAAKALTVDIASGLREKECTCVASKFTLPKSAAV
jgi:tetratricopeptide (TPR) repeat protein